MLLISSGALLPARNSRNCDSLVLHERFQQRHGFRERVRAATEAAGATGSVEGRAALSIFRGQIRAVRDQEFDEFVEAVFGRAVQRGLIRDSVRTGNLAAPAVGLR